MTSEKATTLAEAVGHRFDSIFSSDEDPASPRVTLEDTITINSSDSPIIDLKSIIMSIEWEITERLMDRLHREVADLTTVYRNNSIPLQFLKIMDVLGKYINNRKAEAHPDSIKLMSQAFTNFEAVVLNTDLAKADQQELLQATVRDFKQLKQKISATVQEGKTLTLGQTSAEPEVPAPPAVPASVEAEPAPDTTHTMVRTVEYSDPEPQTAAISSGQETMTPHEAFALAVEELKNLIKAEFSALRAEIRLWREGQ
jgi:hypothetical protein